MISVWLIWISSTKWSQCLRNFVYFFRFIFIRSHWVRRNILKKNSSRQLQLRPFVRKKYEIRWLAKFALFDIPISKNFIWPLWNYLFCGKNHFDVYHFFYLLYVRIANFFIRFWLAEWVKLTSTAICEDKNVRIEIIS